MSFRLKRFVVFLKIISCLLISRTFDGVDDRMISNIDLNPASGADDIVHVFILFRLKSHSGPDSHFRNGLFGHDNQGKFIAYKPTNNLLISGVHGTNNVEVTSSDWQTKADASVLNKWHCLSVHWDVPAGANKSSCWVNGKKVKTFRAKTSPGSNTLVFGDLDPGKLAPLNGDIQLFLLYKGWNMDELIIKAHHKMICERYGWIILQYLFLIPAFKMEEKKTLTRKKSVLNFNHIDQKNLERKDELEKLYAFYRKLWYCYKKVFSREKKDSPGIEFAFSDFGDNGNNSWRSDNESNHLGSYFWSRSCSENSNGNEKSSTKD